MPHEKIYHDEPTSGYGFGREDLTVSWDPLRSVAVSIDVGKPFSFRTGRQQDAPVEDAIYHELFINLDRAEINRMIKALRRARDSAFGRDE